MSLRTRILLLCTAPALLVGVTATWIVTSEVRQEILERVRQNGEREGETRAAWLDDFARRRLGELRALAAAPEVRRGDPAEILDLLTRTHAILEQAFEALYWTDVNGRVVGTDGASFSVTDRDYYPDVLAGREVVTPLSASRASGKPVILTLMPVFAADGARIGAVGGTVILDDLLADVRSAVHGATGVTLLLDASGALVAASDGLPSATAELVTRVAELPADVGLVPLRADGEEILVTTEAVPELGWRLAIAHRSDQLLGGVHTARRAALAFVAGSLLIALAVGAALARRALQPLDRLCEAIRRFHVGAGGATVPVPESGGTEVAELGRAFNAMARRVEAEELGRLRTERALLQAQKMESLGLAGSAIAHDFNNLLTVFSSAGETIERHAEEPKVRRMTRLIANTVTRGTALTNRLLGLARERPLELTIEDLRDVVLRMGEVLRRLIPESVDLRVEAGKVPCRARVDAHQIEQVVMNLVINARDALPNAEGRIDVRVDAIEVDATYARMIGGLHAGPHARLVVTDDGLGMSPEIARNAMEPLFTTKEPGTGTGLGLAIGELVARDHGGALTIDSAEGEGTIVTLLVPLASGEDAPQKDDPDGRVISRRLRVAVSEDDEHVRLAIVGALVDLGYEVYDFASGEQLLGWMGNHADLPVDLLITDVVMRGLSGPETAREVRGRGAACHVIYVSGYGHEELGNHGAVLLRKPFGRAQLAHAIAAACGENDLETQRS